MVDWQRCITRHERARNDENLGNKRPLTSWVSQGHATLPDFAWHDWGKAQVERVLDLMDINYLRGAAKGEDINYKTLVWNLSQNVDRETGASKPGLCPCLTPNMVPYITNRGGPLVGHEVLSLQVCNTPRNRRVPPSRRRVPTLAAGHPDRRLAPHARVD